MYGFQSAILSTGNNVQQDDIIGGIFETDGIKGVCTPVELIALYPLC